MNITMSWASQQKITKAKEKYFYGKNYELRHREGSQTAERDFYLNLCYLALADFPESYLTKINIAESVNILFSALEFLGFYLESKEVFLFLIKQQISQTSSVLDAFAELLEVKLKMEDNDKDLVFMQNEFQVQKLNGTIVNKKLDLIVIGNHNNTKYSATALTVAYPSAITVQV